MAVYAEPKKGVRLEETDFYHRLDLPELEKSNWRWDLRGREAEYLGNFQFAGKRVLEIGTASGALCFWMEKQGADVVAVDLSPDVENMTWDTLLLPDDDPAAVRDGMARTMRELNNGFWYAHERLGSNAKLVHSTAYSIPRELGKFDVVVLGAVLLHLRDPLGALENALPFTDRSAIIADLIPFNLTKEELRRPLACFMPEPKSRTTHGGWTWWHVSPEVYLRYLKLKGFAIISHTKGAYQHRFSSRDIFTIVAEREQRTDRVA